MKRTFALQTSDRGSSFLPRVGSGVDVAAVEIGAVPVQAQHSRVVLEVSRVNG
jgi:hypothetical protein